MLLIGLLAQDRSVAVHIRPMNLWEEKPSNYDEFLDPLKPELEQVLWDYHQAFAHVIVSKEMRMSTVFISLDNVQRSRHKKA